MATGAEQGPKSGLNTDEEGEVPSDSGKDDLEWASGCPPDLDDKEPIGKKTPGKVRVNDRLRWATHTTK